MGTPPGLFHASSERLRPLAQEQAFLLLGAADPGDPNSPFDARQFRTQNRFTPLLELL
jgi:hypothetical protein